MGKVLMKGAAALFLPAPLRIARVVWHMIPFLSKGLRCLGRRRIKVELLDALSIGISAFRRDFGTAGTVMFLLEIGGAAGGLDTEEVRGRLGGEPVPPCGSGVAENAGRGRAHSHRPD